MKTNEREGGKGKNEAIRKRKREGEKGGRME